MDDMKDGEVREFWWVKSRNEVPEGWKISDQRRDCHHNQYGLIIEKETSDAAGE